MWLFTGCILTVLYNEVGHWLYPYCCGRELGGAIGRSGGLRTQPLYKAMFPGGAGASSLVRRGGGPPWVVVASRGWLWVEVARRGWWVEVPW